MVLTDCGILHLFNVDVLDIFTLYTSQQISPIVVGFMKVLGKMLSYSQIQSGRASQAKIDELHPRPSSHQGKKKDVDGS